MLLQEMSAALKETISVRDVRPSVSLINLIRRHETKW
jgi:hypothetical protein